jgi:hypothetical protein
MKESASETPDHLQAYLTLGIVLGAEDFEERMAALRHLCAYFHEKRKGEDDL